MSLYIKVFPGAGYRHDKSLHDDFFPGTYRLSRYNLRQ